MKPLTRSEKIQVYRGTIQTIGLIIIIAGMIWMVKNFNDRKIMGECIFEHKDGTRETTGLYGNCTWYATRIKDYYKATNPNTLINEILETPGALQKVDFVNPPMQEDS